jgi:hypothetical protein
MLKISSLSTRSSQAGSAHVVVALVLVVAIIGAIGYLYWRQTGNQAKAQANVSFSQEVEVTGDTDVDELAGASVELKKFIVGRIDTLNKESDSEGFDCFNVVNARTVIQQKYAIGDIFTDGDNEECGGRSTEIWALDTNNTWQIVEGTQDEIFTCDKLKKYSIPVEIAGAECYNAAGDLIKYSI